MCWKIDLSKLIVVAVVLAFITISTIIATRHGSQPDSPRGQPNKTVLNSISKLDSLIDSLANSNPEPELIELDALNLVPVFDRNYDWNEQGRVVKAIQKVLDDPTAELWERLVRHQNDHRYCLTFNDQIQGVDHYAVNWSVGAFCREIASFQLTFPAEHATKSLLLGDGERVITLPLVSSEPPPKEAQADLEKSLAMRQIEICEWALTNMSKPDELPSGRKIDDRTLALCRSRIEAVIRELRQSKDGILGRYPFPGERFELYNLKMAVEISKMVETSMKRPKIDSHLQPETHDTDPFEQ